MVEVGAILTILWDGHSAGRLTVAKIIPRLDPQSVSLDGTFALEPGFTGWEAHLSETNRLHRAYSASQGDEADEAEERYAESIRAVTQRLLIRGLPGELSDFVLTGDSVSLTMRLLEVQLTPDAAGDTETH